MGIRQRVGQLLQVLLVIVVVALIAGQLLGQPLLLSFVTSGSMEPTLDTGDGFVAVPPELAGGIEEGDVIVFEAEQIQGGGLTTHRVVDQTEQGYITQGDANAFTDQDSGEEPVKEPQIVAVAWQPGGSVLAIPKLGTVVMGIQSWLGSLQRLLAQLFGTQVFLGPQGLAYLIFAGSIALYLLLDIVDSTQTDRERTVSRETGTSSRRLVVLLTVVLLAGVTASMVVPAQSEEFGIVSAEFESERPDVIEQGTNKTFDRTVQNTGIIPTVVMIEPVGEQIDATPDRLSVDSREMRNITVTVSAPPETGYYQFYVEQHRYLSLLPRQVIGSLYQIHPWLPILAINVVIGVPFYIFGLVLLGTGRIRTRNRERNSWFPW
jgi:signal peptidase